MKNNRKAKYWEFDFAVSKGDYSEIDEEEMSILFELICETLEKSGMFCGGGFRPCDEDYDNS